MIGTIQYGTVTLLMCWCELSRRPIRTPDDTTYEFTFDVLCTFNNSATSVVSLSPGEYTPNTNKSAPGRTDIALREYLAQPRRQLIARQARRPKELSKSIVLWEISMKSRSR
jgi:hypothetical protein